jgi:phosphoribosylformylglycinamidine cyclo-ligase
VTTYKDAGVDIKKASSLVETIRQISKPTLNSNVVSGIGGFAAAFKIPSGYEEPLIVSCTDGVGTKLKVASRMNSHTSIGVDLVAMCTNDLNTLGADALAFLDYFASGRVDENVVKEIMEGITDACMVTGCSLIGGEIAEMPGMYSPGDYDIAGFCIGVVDRNKAITGDYIEKGDVLIGIPSSGLHSNGYSIVNKILEDNPQISLESTPFTKGEILGWELLTPTRLYAELIRVLKSNFSNGILRGIAHITGGGLHDNIVRMRKGMEVDLFGLENHQYPEIFKWVQRTGNVAREEMERTFNCGYGLVLCVDWKYEKSVIDLLSRKGEVPRVLGKVA